MILLLLFVPVWYAWNYVINGEQYFTILNVSAKERALYVGNQWWISVNLGKRNIFCSYAFGHLFVRTSSQSFENRIRMEVGVAYSCAIMILKYSSLWHEIISSSTSAFANTIISNMLKWNVFKYYYRQHRKLFLLRWSIYSAHQINMIPYL